MGERCWETYGDAGVQKVGMYLKRVGCVGVEREGERE